MKITEHQAKDGTRFATADECKRHEHNIRLKSLVNMNDEQLEAALLRTDIPLADAIEFAGTLIAQKRRADGGAKRKKKTIAEKRAEGAAIAVAKAAEATAMIAEVGAKQAKKK